MLKSKKLNIYQPFSYFYKNRNFFYKKQAYRAIIKYFSFFLFFAGDTF